MPRSKVRLPPFTEYTMRLRSLIFSSLLGFSMTATAATADLHPKVLIETNVGNITLELDGEKAPKSVENFVAYVNSGHYNGTIFHRVIKDFMIQGGGIDKSGGEKSTRAPVQNESTNGLSNLRGTIAMARTNDPHSATSQFFINHKNNDFLNAGARGQWGYAVFGKVTEGLDVVDKIAVMPTGFQDVPKTQVVIEKVSIAK